MKHGTHIGPRAGLLALTFVGLVLGGCRGDSRHWSEERGEVTESWKPEPTPVRGLAPELLRSAVAEQLDEKRPDGIDAAEWRHVHELYEAYQGLPLWLDEDGPNDRARALVSELAKAPTHGLDPSHYPLADLRDALAAVRDGDQPDASRLATADVLLSAAYVALAHDLLVGQVDPRSVAQGWHIDPERVDVDSALAQRLRLEPLDRAIAQLKPENEEYDELRTELERYRTIAVHGDWAKVPEGPSLKPGDSAPRERLEALANRLAAESYLDEGAEPEAIPDSAGRARYDRQLAGAVADFQERHNIVVDSILGGQTLASLNLSARYRADQIAANLERYRWLPRTLGERYILVNVPAFHLTAYDSGQKALDMRVVVGAEYENHATPVFADSMSYLVFRPYWNVTQNIALKEILPKYEADPGYLARHNYEVVRGQSDEAPVVDPWQLSYDAIASGRLRIRQRPGDENSLGFVKFIFPNDFNIYLHDTPARSLFEKDVRAYSHGCIRVQEPTRLAEYALGWDAPRVREAMDTGPDNHVVRLKHKLPVYIVYLTTYLRDGRLYFGNDLYDRDDALVKQVAPGALPDERTLATLAELQQLAEG